MVKAHTPINWENEPSYNTPLNAANLNKMDSEIGILDDRIIEQDTIKLDKATANTMVKAISFDENTGVFTITLLNGSATTIDTKLEKVVVNFSYDANTQQIILNLVDGTTQYIDLSALITQYEFVDSNTIGWEVTTDGKVKAKVLNGSITENMLQPNYLAEIKVEVVKSQNSATASATSEANAKASEENAKLSENNAKESELNSKTSETNAKESETKAKESETASATSASNAKTSETSSKQSETNAQNSATQASNLATSAKTSETNSKTSEINAQNSANKSESYAVGGTGTRENEEIDNAKYYYEQSKSISESFSGALVPMGTVAFEDLPSLEDAVGGWMYNISNEFTTTDDFKEGAGHVIPLGANVFKTFDGFWDVLAGSPVTGIKGSSETSYRRGNVNITASNIGLGNVNNTSDADKPISTATQTALNGKLATNGDSKSNTVTFTSNDVADGSATSWTSVSALASGITHATFFARVSQMFKNVRYLYKMLGTTDISAIGDGSVKGAISTLNSNSENYSPKFKTAILPNVTANANGYIETNIVPDSRFIVSATEYGAGYVVIPTIVQRNNTDNWWFFVFGNINGSIVPSANQTFNEVHYYYYDL